MVWKRAGVPPALLLPSIPLPSRAHPAAAAVLRAPVRPWAAVLCGGGRERGGAGCRRFEHKGRAEQRTAMISATAYRITHRQLSRRGHDYVSKAHIVARGQRQESSLSSRSTVMIASSLVRHPTTLGPGSLSRTGSNAIHLVSAGVQQCVMASLQHSGRRGSKRLDDVYFTPRSIHHVSDSDLCAEEGRQSMIDEQWEKLIVPPPRLCNRI